MPTTGSPTPVSTSDVSSNFGRMLSSGQCMRTYRLMTEWDEVYNLVVTELGAIHLNGSPISVEEARWLADSLTRAINDVEA